MIASGCWPARGWPGWVVRENQPYVVPVYLTYDVLSGGEPCLYGFTTPGQKIEWMRANPLVCVEVDEVTAHDQWVSVIALVATRNWSSPLETITRGCEHTRSSSSAATPVLMPRGATTRGSLPTRSSTPRPCGGNRPAPLVPPAATAIRGRRSLPCTTGSAWTGSRGTGRRPTHGRSNCPRLRIGRRAG